MSSYSFLLSLKPGPGEWVRAREGDWGVCRVSPAAPRPEDLLSRAQCWEGLGKQGPMAPGNQLAGEGPGAQSYLCGKPWSHPDMHLSHWRL